MGKKLYLIFFLSKSLIVFSDFVFDEPNFVFNEQHSLLPYLVQNYKTNNWLLRGDATFDAELSKTILTPRGLRKIGSIWNRIPVATNSWKVVLRYSAFNNRGSDEIADGMALWYVPTNSQWNYEPTHITYGGPSQRFTGLMIGCDSYRVPSQFGNVRDLDSASLNVVFNKNERSFDWWNPVKENTVGQCVVRNRYRNTTNTIATLAVEYVDDILKVYHSNPQEGQKLELCVEKQGLKIPSGYVIGVSASTGGIEGAYEVHSLWFYNDRRSRSTSTVLPKTNPPRSTPPTTLKNRQKSTNPPKSTDLPILKDLTNQKNQTSTSDSETEKLWNYLYVISACLVFVIIIFASYLLCKKKKETIKEETHVVSAKTRSLTSVNDNHDYDYRYYSNMNGSTPAQLEEEKLYENFATKPQTNSTYDRLQFMT